MFSKHKDVISGVFLFLVGLAFFAFSFQIRLTNIDRLVGSRLFPQAGGILLMVLSSVLIIGNFLKNRNAQPAASSRPTEKPVYRNTILVLLSFALYIYLLDYIGFFVATLAYLFTQMLILRGSKATGKTLALYALLSVVATVTIYFMFNHVFYLILPRGKFF